MKKVLSMILVLVMLFAMIPAPTVSAAENDSGEQTSITENVTIHSTNAVGQLLSDDILAQRSQQEELLATGYLVTDLIVEGSLAYVEYSALSEAVIVVGIYDEKGTKLLASGRQEVESGNDGAYVELTGDMPQYFQAVVYMLDPEDNRPLCSNYETSLYTYEMQQLVQSTVYDYDQDLVLNLDSNTTTNFAVYNPNTVRLNEVAGVNTIVSIDEDNRTYVIGNADKTITSLVYGDVLCYAYGSNQYLIVKVSEVDMDGTTATITGMEMDIQDVFAYVKIDGQADTSAVQVDTSGADEAITYLGMEPAEGPATYSWDGESSEKMEMKYKFYDVSFAGDGSGEKISFSGDLGLQMEYSLKYYIALIGSYVKFTVNIEAGITLEAEGKLEKSYPIGDYFIPVLPCVNVGVSPAFKVSFTGKVQWSVKYTQTIGVGFEGGEFRNLTTSPEVVHECQAEITLFVGFDFSPNVSIISPGVANLAVTIPFGVELNVKTTGMATDNLHSFNETHHGCALCLDGQLYFKFSVGAKIEILRRDWLTFTLKIAEVKWPIGSFWFSFDKLDGGFGKCPYKKYTVTVQTVDSNGTPISGVTVTPLDSSYARITDEQGTAQWYLEPETYNISAVKDDMAGSTQEEVNETRKITITMLVTGPVVDGVTWTLDKAGNLTVLGEGTIPSYANAAAAPWYKYTDQIKYVHITDGITGVGGGAFAGCQNLESVYIGSGVSSLNLTAWNDCDKLNRFAVSPNNSAYYTDSQNVLYNKTRTILYKAFTQLPGVYNLPESLTTISGSAFAQQKALSSLVMPETLISVGVNAFTGCTALKLVTFTGNAPTIAANAFSGVTTEALYCTRTEGWTADKLQNYGGSIAWTGYDGLLGSGICGENAVWMLFDDGVMTISGSGAMNDYTETTMPWKNYINKILSVQIKEGITRIGTEAFHGAVNLQEVSVPASLTEVGTQAFYLCNAIEKLHISDVGAWCQVNNGGDILRSKTAFYYEGQMITDLVIPEGTPIITDRAFNYCDTIQTVRIPASVKTIGWKAFYDCDGLTYISIPNGTEQIGEDAFRDCNNLTRADIAGSVQTIEEYAFAGCMNLSELTLAKGIVTIGQHAFNNCDSLQTVAIPETVQNVDWYAFYDCDGLISVRFLYDGGKPCTDIGQYAFASCDALRDVRVGDGVTMVRYGAFKDDRKLATVHIGDNVAELYGSAFENCVSLKDLTMGNGLRKVYADAFKNCNSLENVYISDAASWAQIEYVEYYSRPSTPMYYAKNLYLNGQLLTEAVIPEGVERIGAYAFYNCRDLTSISIPSSMRTIGVGAFSGCDGLERVDIADLAAWIAIDFGSNPLGEAGMLYLNGQLVTDLVIPDGTTAISADAFWGCDSIISVTIPAGLMSIGADAFGGCSALSVVDVADLATWCNITFGNAGANPLTNAGTLRVNGEVLTDLAIPEGITQVNAYAFYNCDTLRYVTIGSWVEYIDQSAFTGCDELWSVTIEGASQGIRSYAFASCAELYSVDLGQKVTSIGDYAFSDCTSLDEIVLPATLRSLGEYAFRNGIALCRVYFMGYAPKIGTGAFSGITADVGYRTGCGWSTSNMLDYGGTLRWFVLYDIVTTSEGEMPETAEQPMLTENVQENPVLMTSVEPEVASQENVVTFADTNSVAVIPNTDKTVTFTGLDVGADYVLLVLCSTQEEELLTHENLVYLWQTVADASGTATFTYTPRDGVEVVYELLCGGRRKDLEDATVNVPALEEVQEDRLFTPQVFYNGVLLTEGVDYELLGDVTYTKAGDYTCYIRGLGDYTGMYTCTYMVNPVGSVGLSYYGGAAEGLDYYYLIGIGSCTDTDLVIPAEHNGLPVKYIDSYAFENVKSITSVTIPEGVTSIGNNAFSDCSNLTTVKIADSVTELGSYAFRNCTALTDLYIGKGASALYNTFDGCENIKNVYITDLAAWCEVALSSTCSPMRNGGNLYVNGELLTELVVPDGVTEIGDNAFYGCMSLTSVTIPEGVASIGEYAFANCRNIQSVNLSNSLRSIDIGAFYQCTALTRVDIADLSAWCAKKFGDSSANPLAYAKNLHRL